jgi:catechol 2,3-dioxygenase-like lactoylglutathione lyase family enzyme
MADDIVHLHHVGLVVRDMEEALERYRRLGFLNTPPAYPMLAPEAGAEPRPFGAANCYAPFERNFIELVSCIEPTRPETIPADAKPVVLQAPPAMLPMLNAQIARTAANMSTLLARFEGLHILMFESADAYTTAARLTEDGVGHGGAQTVQRPVDTPEGTVLQTLRFLEIDGDDPALGTGRVPEGRLGVAEQVPVETRGGTELTQHPNGATCLVEVVVCVAPDDLPAVEARYATYLSRTARDEGAARVFELEGSRVALVASDRLGELLPGEQAPALPALVAYTVAVRDADATRVYLEGNGVPVRTSGAGDVFVPAEAALGAAVVFRTEP